MLIIDLFHYEVDCTIDWIRIIHEIALDVMIVVISTCMSYVCANYEYILCMCTLVLLAYILVIIILFCIICVCCLLMFLVKLNL